MNQLCIATSRPVIFPRLFYTNIRESIQCLRCKESHTTINSHPSISLHLPLTKDPITVTKSLERETDTVILSDYYCDICKRYGDASKECVFLDFPPILIITPERDEHHLTDIFKLDLSQLEKRNALRRAEHLDYIYRNLQISTVNTLEQPSTVSPQFAYSTLTESNTKPLFPPVKDATQNKNTPAGEDFATPTQVNNDATYELRAMAFYRGDGHEGHYTAACFSDMLGKWVYFNDDQLPRVLDQSELEKTFNLGHTTFLVYLRKSLPKALHIPFVISPLSYPSSSLSPVLYGMRKNKDSFSVLIKAPPKKKVLSATTASVAPQSPISRTPIISTATPTAGGIPFSPSVMETPKKQFKCQHPECKFSTDYSGNLSRHLLSHSDSKPYKCGFPLCPHTARRKDAAIQHEMTHSPLRQYYCEDCKKMIADWRNFRSHLLNHIYHDIYGEKPTGIPTIIPSFHPQKNPPNKRKAAAPFSFPDPPTPRKISGSVIFLPVETDSTLRTENGQIVSGMDKMRLNEGQQEANPKLHADSNHEVVENLQDGENASVQKPGVRSESTRVEDGDTNTENGG